MVDPKNADRVANIATVTGRTTQQAKQALVHAAEAALALGRARDVEDMLARIDHTPAGRRPRFMEAQSLRLHGRLERDPQRLADAAQLFVTPG